MTETVTAESLADHLLTHQWYSEPEFPLLHEPSAHQKHHYNSYCAICRGEWVRVAEVALAFVGPPEQAQRQALTEASDLLWAWADEMGDVGGTGPQAARRRTIRACARKIAPEPTDDEMRTALAGLLTGMADRPKAGAPAQDNAHASEGADDTSVDGPLTDALERAESALIDRDDSVWHPGDGGHWTSRYLEPMTRAEIDQLYGPTRAVLLVNIEPDGEQDADTLGSPPARAQDGIRPAAWEQQATDAAQAALGDAWHWLTFDPTSRTRLAASAVRAIIDAGLAGPGGRCPTCQATYPRTMPPGEDARCWTCSTADQADVTRLLVTVKWHGDYYLPGERVDVLREWVEGALLDRDDCPAVTITDLAEREG